MQDVVVCASRDPLAMCLFLGAGALCMAAGFLTPVICIVIAIAQILLLFLARTGDWPAHIMALSILIALAALGPGAYSIDGLLFGRRRLAIGHSQS